MRRIEAKAENVRSEMNSFDIDRLGMKFDHGGNAARQGCIVLSKQIKDLSECVIELARAVNEIGKKLNM